MRFWCDFINALRSWDYQENACQKQGYRGLNKGKVKVKVRPTPGRATQDIFSRHGALYVRLPDLAAVLRRNALAQQRLEFVARLQTVVLHRTYQELLPPSRLQRFRLGLLYATYSITACCGVLVVAIWLELCTSYGSSCHQPNKKLS